MSIIKQAIDAVVGTVGPRAEAVAGGSARLQIVLVLASVLTLDTADKAVVSAVADSLKGVFHIGNGQIGLLIAVASFVGAVFTLPIGVLVDRIRRNRILIAAIVLWSVAMAASGFSNSFLFMLVTRLFVGGITAAAFPSIASLTGDYFPARVRARIYGLILSGELIGAGIGFLIGGVVSSWLGWRSPFFLLAACGLGVAWVVWRFLPEPARGGQDWLSEGQRELPDHADASQVGEACGSRRVSKQETAGRIQEGALRAGVEPREQLVLQQDPANRSLWWALRYVVQIPTYLLLVAASSLAYFFFGGVRGFAMIYLTQHYGVSRSTLAGLVLVVGIGALIGVVSGGALAERLLQRGWFTTRVVLPAVALLICAMLMGAAIWTTELAIGIPLLTAGAAALAAANPSYDAARLDVMHPRLWGRAESGRMAIRAVFEGGAPLLFGFVSEWLGGGQVGLERTFLLMLIPLLIAASLAIPARRTYPRDVATAGASIKRTVTHEA